MSEVISPTISSKPVSRRWNVRRILAISGLAVLLLVAGGVITLLGQGLLGGGSPNETRVTTFSDWRLVCPPVTPATPNCALTTEVMRDTGGTFLTLSMTDPKPGSTLSLTVPHGVMLEPGIAFTVGNEPARVRPYETCTNVGCIALVTVDADLLKALEANMNGQVSVAAPNNPQPLAIPFSLKGFAEGYGALERASARRTGFFSFLTRT